jgi:hypothetical protein
VVLTEMCVEMLYLCVMHSFALQECMVSECLNFVHDRESCRRTLTTFSMESSRYELGRPFELQSWTVRECVEKGGIVP